MTDLALSQYYANLLILQYRAKPKAYATSQYLALQAIVNQIPLDVQAAFGLDSAVGVQLDTIGKYVGVKRSGNGFFAPITLNDADFRSLITIGILTNNAGSSLADIQNLINIFFKNKIFVFDYQTMQLNYFFDSSAGSQDLVQLLVTEQLLPRPMAVQIASIIYAPGINKFFGYQTYFLPPNKVSPFNTYDNYNMDSPWLTYAYALILT